MVSIQHIIYCPECLEVIEKALENVPIKFIESILGYTTQKITTSNIISVKKCLTLKRIE